MIIADFEILDDQVRYSDSRIVTIKGEAASEQLSPGMNYRLIGRWITHPRHGKQFSFSSFTVEEPADQEAIITYLQQCEGIGPLTAKNIYSKYGDQSVEMLRENPEEVGKVTPRFSPEKAVEASNLLKRNQRLERTKLGLMQLLKGRHFPKKTIDNVIADWGADGESAIKANPYLLMRYRGCGFGNTDKMYLDLGHDPSRLKRQALCAHYSISRDASGDTWFASSVPRKAIESQVSGSGINPHRAMSLSKRAGLLTSRHDQYRNEYWAMSIKALNEANLALRVAEMSEGEHNWPSVDSLPDLSDHQRQELGKALQSRIAVFRGSPGTGKTYSTSRVIQAVISAYGTDQVAVCAPTGKAAVRITEAMSQAGLDIPARTIHSLLEVIAEDGSISFSRGENNPLDQKFIFVDETSMVDTDLMNSLLSATDSATHVLLIGDENQLAPVGHGAPLRDIVNAGVSCGELTEIQRNSGAIVKACAEIRDRNRFTSENRLQLPEGNLAHIEKSTPEGQIQEIENYFNRIKSAENFDPIWDVQVLVAVNKKSPLGRKPLNKRLQVLLNPHGKRIEGNKFRVGDKIINTQNGWFPSVDENSPLANADGKVYVANGEQAEVLEVEVNKTIARLSSPDRMIIIPKGITKESGNDNEEQSSDNGCSWELGYAISVHKSQGSEWPVVLCLIDSHPSAKLVQTRNWLYTGISRAKKYCLTIGKRDIAQSICKRDGLRRKTFLTELIQEEREPAELIDELSTLVSATFGELVGV